MKHRRNIQTQITSRCYIYTCINQPCRRCNEWRQSSNSQQMGGSSKQEVQSNLRNEPALVTSATSGVLLWRSQLVQLVFANHRKSLDIRVISTAFVSFSVPF